MPKLKIQYNSPVILTFSLICCLVFLGSSLFGLGFQEFFTLGPSFNFANPLHYLQIFSYTMGHSSPSHLLGNMSFMLLLGPILEEKYGSGRMLSMIILCALFTGMAHVITSSSTGLLGASGIVFMLIILISITDTKEGYIPLTFILVSLIFVGKEVAQMFENDTISQLAHICGGIIGAACGFFLIKVKKNGGA